MKDAEPNPVTHPKLQSTMSAIIVALGILLSLEQPGTHISEEVISVLQEGINSICAGGTSSIRQQGRWQSTVNNLERRCVEG